MTVGEYIQKIREDRGMLLRDVSEKSGYSISEISRVESGKRLRPSPGVLCALAGALLADYDDLMALDGMNSRAAESIIAFFAERKEDSPTDRGKQ